MCLTAFSVGGLRYITVFYLKKKTAERLHSVQFSSELLRSYKFGDNLLRSPQLTFWLIWYSRKCIWAASGGDRWQQSPRGIISIKIALQDNAQCNAEQCESGEQAWFFPSNEAMKPSITERSPATTGMPAKKEMEKVLALLLVLSDTSRSPGSATRLWYVCWAQCACVDWAQWLACIVHQQRWLTPRPSRNPCTLHPEHGASAQPFPGNHLYQDEWSWLWSEDRFDKAETGCSKVKYAHAKVFKETEVSFQGQIPLHKHEPLVST